MLHLNEPPSAARRGGEEAASSFKVLVLDAFTKNIIAPLITAPELRQKGGVSLYLMLNAQREPIPDVPAVYFLQATEENVHQIVLVRAWASIALDIKAERTWSAVYASDKLHADHNASNECCTRAVAVHPEPHIAGIPPCLKAHENSSVVH